MHGRPRSSPRPVVRQAYQVECTPGYYNNEGHFDPLAATYGAYWRGPTRFIRLLDAWRTDGNLEGLELEPTT